MKVGWSFPFAPMEDGERELSERELGEEEKDEENGVLGFRDVFISWGLMISGFIMQFHKI